MYMNSCNYCQSECFCECHQHYPNQSDDYTYHIQQGYTPKYETAKFKSSWYSNGFEGDTMTSSNEKWKFAQPSNNEQKSSLFDQNGEYYHTFQPEDNKYYFKEIEEMNQPQERPDIDELIKENERLLMQNREGELDDLGRRTYAHTFAGNSNGEIGKNQGDGIMDPSNKNKGGNEDISKVSKDALDEALGFIKYVAMKEGVNYIDDGFYVRNINPFKQLLDTLKRCLYDRASGGNKAFEEQNRNQFEKAVNVIQNEKVPIQQQQQQQLQQQGNSQLRPDVAGLNRNVTYEMMQNQSNIPLKNDRELNPINPMIKEPSQGNQDNSLYKSLNQSNQLKEKNQIPNSQMKMNPLYMDNKPKEDIPIKIQDRNDNISHPNTNIKDNSIPINNLKKNQPPALYQPQLQYYPQPLHQSQTHENLSKKQPDIPKGNKVPQSLNNQPIPLNKGNNNQPEMYYHSYKETPQPQPKQKSSSNKPNKLQHPSQSPMPQNQLNNRENNHSLSPIDDKGNHKAKQQKQPMEYRPNSQLAQLKKEHQNLLNVSNNNKANSNMASFQRNMSPSRNCFACNVQCNISSTGYSPMTYSPYGERKRRRSVTPIKNLYY